MSLVNQNVTELLAELNAGRPDAVANLVDAVYPELRRLAKSCLRSERRNHTLQPTALVNEAFLRLAGQTFEWKDRTHFFGVTAHVMRQVLIEYARRRKAAKRGAEPVREEQVETMLLSEQQSDELLALDQALCRLAALDPRQARIVELRYFAGLTVEETATVLEISPKTVKRDWSVARSWLHREIYGKSGDPFLFPSAH
jgi:RNA polymerase sigma-70 factor, ECF subfamily